MKTKLRGFDALFPFPVKVYFVNLYNRLNQLNKELKTEKVSSLIDTVIRLARPL